MVTDELLDKLRYKSESTDLDFKRAQYLLNRNAPPEAKSELLKDILAMANAWHDGPGYILIGFEDKTPLPAEVLGISDTDHIDEASLQQFVNGKVQPKIEFRYEERQYLGKTIAVITIPKQHRPFALTNSYGSLKSNVAYVRRGSSTDEAQLEEVIKMAAENAGKEEPNIELSILDENNEPLRTSVSLRFLQWGDLPDFYFGSGASFPPVFYPTENQDFWRDASEYVTSRAALIQVKLGLANRSTFALTHTKLEVSISALDSQGFGIMGLDDLPHEPEQTLSGKLSSFPISSVRREEKFYVDQNGAVPLCHIRLGNLLPGEQGWAEDLLAVIPDGPGKLQIRVRILAVELPEPLMQEQTIEATGLIEKLTEDDLDEMLGDTPTA